MRSEMLPPEEPSVLDYLKSRLSWRNLLRRSKRAESGEVSTLSAETAPIAVTSQAVETQSAVSAVMEESPSPGLTARRPPAGVKAALLAVGLGLVAQWLIEPPRGQVVLGVMLYLLATLSFLWALRKGEWVMPPLPALEERTGGVSFRRGPFVLAMLLALAAFVKFGGNRFTPLNLILWGAALALYFLSLWQKEGEGRWRALWEGLRRSEWTVQLRREHLWLLLVLSVAIFFRLHRLSVTPAEPFSDHAEKILDVYDITQGEWSIFFPRNTGREALQMYWTLFVAWVFGTGLSYQSLKLGTALLGVLTLPYLYLLGVELGNRRVGWLALLLGGIAFWPNIISRIGLRFPLYPLFVAPTLYYLLRGLRTMRRNDFLLAGFFLGLGLHGYSPFRIVPFLVMVVFGVYWLHVRSPYARRQAGLWLLLVALTALLVFLPLLRYMLENPQMYAYRALTRLTSQETSIPGNPLLIFLDNVWRGLLMFHWDDGDIWVVSIPHRPALDVVTAVFFLFGVIGVLWRYLRQREWRDLVLLWAIPILQLPSTLSIAFPNENPAPNRASGVYVVVFVLIALALDGFLRGLEGRRRRFLASGMLAVLLLLALGQNYTLTFEAFDQQYRLGTWNTSDMGAVLRQFATLTGSTDAVWIVPYPYWVDTRLPGVWAGIPNRDFALWPDQLEQSLSVPPPKLFIYRPDDTEAAEKLRTLYPNGILRHYASPIEGHDFYIYYVP